ncbi:LLM class flavin-dependent oxidoreductase [Kribbella sp. VKM Ac-2566]|uniref:LLM class flavin-dependent oxidoreductase n=1 Tax=Kribbella sp. VKM Ac-2566 TaxID=2512218 RepID=UPI0010632114|nr:LLM class flavin-dependent oxidoreductase [Kribbella sp. VKM Ac-2566]TDX08265.1 alkanesulfonate monooxygenase SsuD/methylene tetrahydromethanopterin reductase-like flavin-dependent oxidoreductase (luciferase family) [Kribbella sp. VKM Ac-2566]
MVKPILQLYPMLPAADELEREVLRPLGRNVERYQEALAGLDDLVTAADDLGFWGVSTIEHHFHSEGYEIGPNPALLNAHWAAKTKRVRVGQLGFTMSAQNPIRVAEDTAIIDHLTKGRCFVGFSRGYQSRWTNILGQHLGTRATASPQGWSDDANARVTEAQRAAEISDDEVNRRIFQENIDIVLSAWKQESIDHDSNTWQIPYPYRDGLAGWGMREVTRRLGAPGEVDEQGRIRRVSVTPAPYTDPHPPVFVASNASKETVEYCGTKGFVPTYFSPVSRAVGYAQAYVDRAHEAGHEFALGQNQALVRWMQIAETREQAHRAVLDYDVEIYKNLYSPLTPHGGLAFDEANPVQSVLDSGVWVAGSVDEVREAYVAEWKQLPAEFVVLIFHYAQQPKESVIRNMELFMEHVKPALDELTEYAATSAPARKGA